MSALFRGRIERICVLVKVLMFCIEALKRILARHRGFNASNDANGVGENRVARALTPAAPHLSTLNYIYCNAYEARVPRRGLWFFLSHTMPFRFREASKGTCGATFLSIFISLNNQCEIYTVVRMRYSAIISTQTTLQYHSALKCCTKTSCMIKNQLPGSSTRL